MTASPTLHPEQALLDPDEGAVASLPVCDQAQLNAELLISAAQAADWAPTRQGDTLKDRAYSQLPQRARCTAFAGGPKLPAAALALALALATWFTPVTTDTPR